MYSLSVITLTCNRLGLLERLWERLREQLGPKDEWILIDTGSNDGTREYFADWPDSRIKFMLYDAGGSWAEIRNFGVRAASGALLAFLDDDCLPAADWTARGRTHL